MKEGVVDDGEVNGVRWTYGYDTGGGNYAFELRDSEVRDTDCFDLEWGGIKWSWLFRVWTGRTFSEGNLIIAFQTSTMLVSVSRASSPLTVG